MNSYKSYISRLFFQKAITNLDTQGKLQQLGLLQLSKVRVIFKIRAKKSY